MSDTPPTFLYPRDWIGPDGRQRVPSAMAVELLRNSKAANLLAQATELWELGWGVELTLRQPRNEIQEEILLRQHATKEAGA